MNPLVRQFAKDLDKFIYISDKDVIYLIAVLLNKSSFVINHENVTHEVHSTIGAKSNKLKPKTKKRKQK
jgi:hypothetical protein